MPLGGNCIGDRMTLHWQIIGAFSQLINLSQTLWRRNCVNQIFEADEKKMVLVVETDHRCRITFAFPERKKAKHTWVFWSKWERTNDATHTQTQRVYIFPPSSIFSAGWLLLQSDDKEINLRLDKQLGLITLSFETAKRDFHQLKETKFKNRTWK